MGSIGSGTELVLLGEVGSSGYGAAVRRSTLSPGSYGQRLHSTRFTKKTHKTLLKYLLCFMSIVQDWDQKVFDKDIIVNQFGGKRHVKSSRRRRTRFCSSICFVLCPGLGSESI